MQCETIDATLTRSTIEIDAELFKLYSLAKRAPAHSAFGEPVAAAIRAQIAVLKGRMTTGKAGEHYEDEHDYILNAALDAAEWLRDNSESLLAGWQIMLEAAWREQA